MPLYERNLGKTFMSNMIKATNIHDILLELLISPEMTKLDLAASTGLSITTVSDCINQLVSGRLLEACGTDSSSGGRRPSIYRLRPGYGYVAGVWLTREGMEAAVIRMDAQQTKRLQRPLEPGVPLLVQLEALLDGIRKEQGGERPVALGVSLPGSVNAAEGVVLQSPCGDWASVPLREILERRYSTAAYVDHAANCCARFLQTLGGARHISSFLCLMSRCPDKAALVVDGKVLRGKGNLCGANGARLCACAEELGLEAVLTDLPKEECGAPAALYRLTAPVDAAEATALNAEIQWFAKAYEETRWGEKA